MPVRGDRVAVAELTSSTASRVPPDPECGGRVALLHVSPSPAAVPEKGVFVKSPRSIIFPVLVFTLLA